MDPVGFLSKVWGHTCQDGDWVFLATKGTDSSWKEHPIEYKFGWKRRVKGFLEKYPDTQYNIYFCATPFTKAKRRAEFVRHMNILYSDIDTGEPRVSPSILWQSSPGRLQAVWFLRASMNPQEGAELNKSLSYYMGADKGGWDLTQVLRVPGTKNLKYKGHPPVKVVDDNSTRIHAANQIARRTGHEQRKEKEQAKAETSIGISPLSFEQVLSKYRRRLGPRVKQLLCQRTVSEGHRSEMLWFLEAKLNESGLTPPEILRLIKDSNWNKFKGRKDEDHRLVTELQKVIEKHIDVPDPEETEEKVEKELSSGLKVETFRDVMMASDSTPGWLVKGFWMKQSHGIVAGEPKSFKSTLAMDLAVSVAAGVPFLGQYEVDNPGPVIIVQNENAKWIMKDRLGKISCARGLGGNAQVRGRTIRIEWGRDLPIYMVNQQGLLLTDPIHQDELKTLVETVKPALIILDPLYLMFDGDINSAKDLSPILNWLMELRYEQKTAVMLVHHYNKGNNGNGAHPKRGGQRMLGSTTLHGWIESAWYVEVDSTTAADDEEPTEVNQPRASAYVKLEREFRGAGLHPPLDCEIVMGEMGSDEYHVEIELHKSRRKPEKGATEQNHKDQILNELKHAKNGISVGRMERELGLSKKEFEGLIDRMLEKGLISRDGSRIVLFKQKTGAST